MEDFIGHCFMYTYCNSVINVCPATFALLQPYCIVGKVDEGFNLAVLRIVNNRQIKFSPIIKHDVIRNTHACIYSLDYVNAEAFLEVLPTP